jgi:hypothetical protein
MFVIVMTDYKNTVQVLLTFVVDNPLHYLFKL